MTHTSVGMLAGAVLTITWIVLGFWAAVFVAAGMVVGAGVVRILEGSLDVRGVAAALRRRRVS